MREILPGGFRELELLRGGLITLHERVLYLVRSAPALPWKDVGDFLKRGAR